LVKTLKPVMIPSLEGIRDELGEAVDFKPRHLTNFLLAKLVTEKKKCF
jgi:hypothetical protein